MAGDWIPMRKDLWDCPEVIRILSAICPQNVRNAADKLRRKCEVVGALFKTWSIFDTFSDDGTLVGYDAESLNELVGIENWAQNLQHVGWLVVNEDSLEMPKFTTYLSKSAKRRMKDAERKKSVRNVSAKCPQNVRNDADKKRTTEEKRREENINTPVVPKGTNKTSLGSRKACQYSDDFEQFWNAYPAKGRSEKIKSWKAYKNALSIATHEQIISGVGRYALSRKAAEGFVKNATTWLNGGCWDDECEAAPKPESRVATAEDLRNWTPSGLDF